MEEDDEEVRVLVKGCKGQWIDYMVSDEIACPRSVVRGETSSVPMASIDGPQIKEDVLKELVGLEEGPEDGRIYTESMIYMPRSFFVNDHRQGFREAEDNELDKASSSSSCSGSYFTLRRRASTHLGFTDAPSNSPPHQYPTIQTCQNPDESGLSENDLKRWRKEQIRRAKMRSDLFPSLPADTLYKIDPVIFDTWLRILVRVPKSVLWLLRLRKRAVEMAGEGVASRIIFTDVAMKHTHILRGRAADIGTPLLTFPKYDFRMCSRVAASVAYATGSWAPWERDTLMVVGSYEEYEERAVEFGNGVGWCWASIAEAGDGLEQEKRQRRVDGTVHDEEMCLKWVLVSTGRLALLRRRLFLTRDTMPLFDTLGWVRSLEAGLEAAVDRWSKVWGRVRERNRREVEGVRKVVLEGCERDGGPAIILIEENIILKDGLFFFLLS
ncbi:hypothetical protein BC829DRAFT_428023 [Chytridium lagenaria]|nr:hypothetical protein BC829DRAFT_428023 [Chytridium lagenaria]